MSVAIGTCSAQTDAQARLACYDLLAAKLKAGEAVGPQAAATPTPNPAQSFVQAGPAPAGSKEKSSWYDVGGWFGGSDTPHATIGTPAQFGAEALPPPKAVPGEPPPPEPLDHIAANIMSVAFSGNGRFAVTLDNGQIWKQLDADTGTAQFKRNGGDSVTISRGILGSYNLVVEGHTAMFKVRRIQ